MSKKKKSPRARSASPSPALVERDAAKARRALVRIEERIPVMTDGDLKSLQANAERLAGAEADAQQADAQRLLPLIRAEVDARALARPKRPRRAAAGDAAPKDAAP